MRSILLLLCFAVFFADCKKSVSSSDTGSNPAVASTLMDMSYGTDAHQKMDIYLPANRSADATKVIFLIHGGGWSEGDKADFNAYVAVLQQNLPGYAIINTNYRLATNNQNLFPTQENDVKAATEFVYSKRNEYLVSDK